MAARVYPGAEAEREKYHKIIGLQNRGRLAPLLPWSFRQSPHERGGGAGFPMWRCLVAVVLVSATSGAGAAEYPVAGLAPDRRPDGAPTIVNFVRPAGWERRFFSGVAEPRPESLSWSAEQGGWYTPFDRPGAPGPYDIRNWYGSKGKQR